MPIKRKKRKPHPWIERLLAITLALVPVLLIATWLTFQHIPSWYKPVQLGPHELQSPRNQAIEVTDYVGDQIVKGQSFDLVLNQQSVNEWLAMLPYGADANESPIPDSINDPAIGFFDGAVRFGARYKASAWQAIVSVTLSVTVSNDGDTIAIGLGGAHGGSLPVPERALDRLVEPLLQSLHRQREKAQNPSDALSQAISKIETANQLRQGVTVENRFVWFNGDRPFRIEAIEIASGELRLRIEPL